MRNYLLGAAFLLAACGPSTPKKPLTPDEIRAMTKLDDLMHVQARNADPLFKRAKLDAWTDADWAMIPDTVLRLDASSTKVKTFSKGAPWDQFTDGVNQAAAALGKAAETKDLPAAKAAIVAMKGNCKSCHSKYK